MMACSHGSLLSPILFMYADDMCVPNTYPNSKLSFLYCNPQSSAVRRGLRKLITLFFHVVWCHGLVPITKVQE